MKFGPLENLKNKLLSRGGGKIDTYVLSAYGKLPIYKDYIMWDCHLPGAAEFKRWLDESFGLTWEEFGGKNVRPDGPSRVLFLLPSAKAAIVGVVWPSADEGNMRKFPFALYTSLRQNEMVGRGVRGAIETARPIWRSLVEQYDAARKCTDIDQQGNQIKD